jgi:hypothetical protein
MPMIVPMIVYLKIVVFAPREQCKKVYQMAHRCIIVYCLLSCVAMQLYVGSPTDHYQHQTTARPVRAVVGPLASQPAVIQPTCLRSCCVLLPS